MEEEEAAYVKEACEEALHASACLEPSMEVEPYLKIKMTKCKGHFFFTNP